MRKISISDKLIIASFVLSIITIIIVASYSFYNAKAAILERTFNQLTSVRVVKKNLLEGFFYSCSKELQLAKSSAEIKQIALQINKSLNKPVVPEDMVTNNSFINELSGKGYSGVYVVGINNEVFPIKKTANKKADYGFLWDLQNPDAEPYISDYTFSHDTSMPVIIMSSKITGTLGKVIGMLVFEIPVSSIDSIMLEMDASTGLGLSGESYLVGTDFLMRSSSRFQKNSVLKTVVRTRAAEQALMGKTGLAIIKDYRQIRVLSSFGKLDIPNFNWVILSEIDYEEATIPIYEIRNEIVFISIFIFFIVLVVVIVFSKKITYPIQRLNQAVHEVGSGNFDIKLEKISNDEIGELTGSFNKMAIRLKKQTKELKTLRLKSLSSLIDGQESERQRVSRELHDGLGQLLIGLKLRFENFRNQLNNNNKELDELGSLFDKTIEETRRISNNLMPAALTEFGLFSAIRNICNVITGTSDINIQFHTQGTATLIAVREKTYVFRIVQEALTNVVKHSNATYVDLGILINKDKIILKIDDDGQGFDPSEINFSGSNGLNNIKDRVALLSGRFKLKSAPAKGTKIEITIPLKIQANG